MYRAVRRLIFGGALVALPSLTAATADASTGGLHVSSHVAAAVSPSDAAAPYVPPVGTRDDPPYYSIVAGNCPAVKPESPGSSGTWTTVDDTDYGGSVFYNSSYGQVCDGDKIAYAPTSSSYTAQFRWHFLDDVVSGPGSRVSFHAYIPYHDATDIKARYDFWYQKSSGGPVIWSLAWYDHQPATPHELELHRHRLCPRRVRRGDRHLVRHRSRRPAGRGRLGCLGLLLVPHQVTFARSAMRRSRLIRNPSPAGPRRARWALNDSVPPMRDTRVQRRIMHLGPGRGRLEDLEF